jgi:hypothetical protein
MSISHPRRYLTCCVLLPLLCACAAYAGQPESKGKSGKDGAYVTAGVDVGVSAPIPGGMISAGISIGDARHLASQYQLTDSKPLPPGIRKNLARGKPMPPGIAKTRLPEPFIGQLPHHPGYEWRQAGADLVLVVSGSLVISDVLKGVFD